MSRLATLPLSYWSLLYLRAEDGLEWFFEGALLDKAEKVFDVFLTGDRNLTFQQILSSSDIAVVVLRSDSTQLRHMLVLVPKILELVPNLRPGDVVNVSG